FGDSWKDYVFHIENEWKKHIHEEDLVLVPGDLSWAKTLNAALIDLNWIDSLPGTKIIIKGNHDYWWESTSKMQKVIPSSIKFIQNDSYTWNDVTIGGSRLWDTEEYNFNKYIEYIENPRENKKENQKNKEEQEKIFVRELERLKLSLNTLDPAAKIRIALTHYPPIGADLGPSRASAILEAYEIDICVFGHLHSIKQGLSLFGEKNGIRYIFASCDYLKFIPLRVL
ncbi:MAG: phosphoesterase, partial [Proteobacteria bacterium]|nr:phosphoesterase [Pseudomonadota bacterium]